MSTQPDAHGRRHLVLIGIIAGVVALVGVAAFVLPASGISYPLLVAVGVGYVLTGLNYARATR